MYLDSKRAKPFLFFSFIFIVVLIILSNIIAFEHLNNVQNNINQIIDTQNTQMSLMHKMRSLARERIITLQAISNEKDPFKQDESIIKFHEVGGLFLEARELLIKTNLTDEEKTLLKLQRETARIIVASQYKVIKLAEKGNNKEAVDHLIRYTTPAQNENMSLMDQFILYQNHQNLVLSSEAQKKNQAAYQTVFLLSFFSILLIIIVASAVIKNITAMLNLQSESIKKHKKTQKQLTDAREILELEVEQRTKQLQEANNKLQHQTDQQSRSINTRR